MVDHGADDIAAFRAALDSAQEAVGENFRPFAGSHHARFIDRDVPLHVISRVFQGRHLLRPCPELNDIILGVIGRAQQRYRSVELHAFAFMSNHVHLMLQGPPKEVPAFIGFIKREISRRWGGNPDVDWPGAMWHDYIATALPTPESQVRCLKYILSQGVKEGLVQRAQDWPGIHAAANLFGGNSLRGRWLDGTELARAIDRERRRFKPNTVNKSDYYIEYEVTLTPIPTWRHLDPAIQERLLQELAVEIEQEGRAIRNGRPPAGIARLLQVPFERRTPLPPLPWFEARRRMICWASPHAPATRHYLDRYWQFQSEFREASKLLRAGEAAAGFPPGAFKPGSIVECPAAA